MDICRESHIRMGTLMIILLGTLLGTVVVAEQCKEPSIENGVVVGTQTLDAYFGRVSCLPGFQVLLTYCILCSTLVTGSSSVCAGDHLQS